MLKNEQIWLFQGNIGSIQCATRGVRKTFNEHWHTAARHNLITYVIWEDVIKLVFLLAAHIMTEVFNSPVRSMTFTSRSIAFKSCVAYFFGERFFLHVSS